MAVVLTQIEGSVGTITLNRPEAMNAITVELGIELERALAELAPAVGAVVIRGADGNFSVGGDFNELERLRAEGEEAMAELFDGFGRACALIAELPVPVVAAVDGYAMAGGFELMQSCDIALVADEAKIGDNHSNYGMVPGGGSSQRLPRLAGLQRALALILTGERLSGPDAVAWGLAYRSLPADELHTAAGELAQKLAAKDRDAIARTKRLIHDGLERPLAEGLAMERQAVLAHLSGERAGAGIELFTKGIR